LGFAREVYGRRKNGTVFPLDLAISEVVIGGRRIFSAIIRDITERKRAEQELKRLHLQNEMILNSAGEGICGLDAGGNVIFVNPAAERMLGWKAEELIGKPLHDTALYARSDGQPYPREECPVCFSCQGIPRSIPNYEVFWRKDGSSFQVEYTSNPITEGEKIVGAVLTFRDITERRMLEAQLRQAQKLESIGQLAAGIAHEINTPTQYIGDNTRFLQDMFENAVPMCRECLRLRDTLAQDEVTRESLADLLAAVEQADLEYLLDEVPKALAQSLEGVERVATIVRSMKEFSHPGAEEKQAIDLNRAMDSTLTISRNEWKYIADVVTDFDPELPLVTCMPADCNQVFLNLIVNAAHAIAEKVGDGSASKGTITVRTRRVGDVAEVRVEDTGTGIPEHIRSRVFDPFFTTKEVGRGTGQGLAIAHTIVVDKHGGTITFNSRPGEGTTFIIRLPICPES
jgi:PAS domain S-box-containing protein